MSCGSSAPISSCHAAPVRHVMWLQFGMSCGSSLTCHAAPVRHFGSQHCGSPHCGSQHCGSQHCRAASCHAAPLMGRVEMKIFILAFLRKVFISFENTNLFTKTLAKTKIFTKKNFLRKLSRKQKFLRKVKMIWLLETTAQQLCFQILLFCAILTC
jgi:hypothetical protein